MCDLAYDYLYNEYVILYKSAKEIAKANNLTREQIYQRLYKLGINGKNRGLHPNRKNKGKIICTKCKKSKSKLCFKIRTTRNNKSIYDSQCKECKKRGVKVARNRKYKYYLNKDNKTRQIRISKRRQEVDKYKVKYGCYNCGYNTHGLILDFHHLNPSNKDKNVSKLFEFTNYEQKINEEISKCIILCSNCHRLVTHNLLKLDYIIIDREPFIASHD